MVQMKASGDTIVLKTPARREIHQAAEAMDLEHVSVDAPLKEDGSRHSLERWLVVGKTRLGVFAKISEISCACQRSQHGAKQARHGRIQALHRDVVGRLTASQKSGTWNVVGSWSIRAPCIESNLGNGKEKFWLDIYLLNDSRGCQMFAIFDFILIRGVMRFIDPNPLQVTSRLSGGRMRKGDEVEELDEEEDDEEEESSDEFYIESKTTPSCSNPTWQYRWRGVETRESEIQLYSDENICSITFKGQGGSELEGKFKSGICCDECHFSGLKRSSTSSSPMPDPRNEWSRRSERAYKYASAARWG